VRGKLRSDDFKITKKFGSREGEKTSLKGWWRLILKCGRERSLRGGLEARKKRGRFLEREKQHHMMRRNKREHRKNFMGGNKRPESGRRNRK